MKKNSKNRKLKFIRFKNKITKGEDVIMVHKISRSLINDSNQTAVMEEHALRTCVIFTEKYRLKFPVFPVLMMIGAEHLDFERQQVTIKIHVNRYAD